jgi:MFS superfamily sulfate permease-like transporter
MAYSSIVGVPPIMGLYSIVPGLVAYALLGTSRQLVVGPDTATGLISALTVGALAAQGTEMICGSAGSRLSWVRPIYDRVTDGVHGALASGSVA